MLSTKHVSVFPEKEVSNIYTRIKVNGAQLMKKLTYEIVMLQLLTEECLSPSDVNCMGIGRLFLVVKPRRGMVNF